jgi:hypothetical protein
MNRPTPKNFPINVHELLKRQVYNEEITPHSRNDANASGNPNTNKYMFFDQSRPYSDQTFGVSDNYLILDSFTKSPVSSNLERGEISWNIQMQGATNIEQGIIGSINLLDNVIEMELGSFTLPILKEVPYPPLNCLNSSNILLIQNNSIPDNSVNLSPVLQPQQIPQQAPPSLPTTNPPNELPWFNNPLTQTPFGGLMTIQVKEAGVQAYSGGHTSALHHFIYQIQYQNQSLGITPNATNVVPMFESSNLFIFTDPISEFTTITLVFRNPDYPIFFESDIISCKIECDFTNAINGKYFLSLKYNNHNLLTEDRIYIKNFNSGIYQLDNYINAQTGLLVGAPPNGCGVSQKKETGEIINGPSFYLDPFITFNENFKHGIINNFTLSKTNTVNIYIITAMVSYPFGSCIISNTINILLIPPNGLQISDIFRIGIMSGMYKFKLSKTTITDICLDDIIYIYDESACLESMQSYNNVYVAKRRITIPIRLRSVVNKVTNYITAV